VKKTLSIAIMAIAAVGLIVAATMLQAQDEAATPPLKTTPLSEQNTTGCICVYYEDVVEGTGASCELGSRVECHYTLYFADSNGTTHTRFQSSKDGPGQPFTCTLGQNLILGWSQGMVGMKEGGTRRLTIPPEFGYGQSSPQSPIPANQWLVFEIDFIKLVK
jgi:FKBP-type peptidyl-prolyl cis-trans isomerase